MDIRRFRARVPLARLCCCAALALWPAAASAGSEVRLLIDVSGSMRENDPGNLRGPALRLLGTLLPAGTVAGAWLFADKVEELLPPRAVDEAWRARARSRSEAIHSRGLYTDIEGALAAATADWDAPAEGNTRHLVLLTDGVVDVARETERSVASRARLIAEDAAALAARGIALHAIALSDGVDRELLETLTGATGGWLERADDAAQLQRSFLHVLEASAPPVTLPLAGNRFEVDAEVSELTLLVFRDGADGLRVTSADGTVLHAGDVPADVHWRSEPGYDLVTVARPAPGAWHFEGPEDADNRAVVVTDLALALEPTPSSLPAGTTLPLRARLTEHGAPVTRSELLATVTARARWESETGAALPETPLALATAEAVFAGEPARDALVPGAYALTVTADSGTFARAVHRRIRIAPAPLAVEITPQAGDTGARVSLTVDPALAKPDSLHGYVVVEAAAVAPRALPLPAVRDGRVAVDVPAIASGEHRIAVHALLELADGRLGEFVPSPTVLALGLPAPAPLPEAAPPPMPAKRVLPWLALANGLIACGLAAAWWLRRRRLRAHDVTAADTLMEDVAGQALSRREALGTIFTSTYGLDGPEAAAKVDEFLAREQAFYQVMTSVYLERDPNRLKELPAEVTRLVAPWLRLTPRDTVPATSAAALASANESLSVELAETRRSMQALLDEYTAAFARGPRDGAALAHDVADGAVLGDAPRAPATTHPDAPLASDAGARAGETMPAEPGSRPADTAPALASDTAPGGEVIDVSVDAEDALSQDDLDALFDEPPASAAA